LVVLSLLVVCIFAVYLAHKRRKFAHIPSPPMSRHLEYGKVVLIWLAHMPFVLVGDPEAVKDALVVKNLPKHPLSYANLCYLYGQRYFSLPLVSFKGIILFAQVCFPSFCTVQTY